MSVIDCKGLSKKYDDFLALNNVDLEIEEGEFFGLLGPNGAGKTTLLKILTGQLRSTKGSAKVLDLIVEDNVMSVKKNIGIVPEQELTKKEVFLASTE